MQLLSVYACGHGGDAPRGVLGRALAASAAAMLAHPDSFDVREASCEIFRLAARVSDDKFGAESADAAARVAALVAGGLRGPFEHDERSQSVRGSLYR